MTNKNFLNTEIAWKFPIVQYTSDVSYYETRRASGISYIILELINKSSNSDEKISQTLESFGIPADIFYIFRDEFFNMYTYKIIQMKKYRNFYIEYWNEYCFTDFEVTEHGKKLFADGEIPTGNINKKEIKVYYDHAMKNTMFKFDSKLYELDEDEIKQNRKNEKNILNNKDIELFIRDNMANYKFKKKEVISEYNHFLPEYFFYELQKAVIINIDQEKMLLIAKDKKRDLYIKSSYSADILSKIIAKKKEYIFSDKKILEKLKKYKYSDIRNIEKIHSPSQWDKIMETKNKLSMSLGTAMKKSEYCIDEEITSEIFSKYKIDAYSCYYENNNLYKILPGSFSMDVEGFDGKCVINLIITEKLTEKLSIEILKFLFSISLKALEPLKQCKVVEKISEISQKKEYIEKFILEHIKRSKNIKDKIDNLIKFNEEFKNSNFGKDIVSKIATKLFERLCFEVTLKNLIEKDNFGKELNKILNYGELLYLEKISKKLSESKAKKIEIYQALEKLGYDIENILSVANVFEIFVLKILKGEPISPRTELAKECILLENIFLKLKKITGIKNTLEDSVKLNLNEEEFLEKFAEFSRSIEKLAKYKKFALEEFNELLSFDKRYTEIKELISIEKEASKNPKKINKSYIENLLKKSKFKDAICDLHIRLEYELRRLFSNQRKKIIELVSELKKKKYLSKEEINDINILKKCRNNFQHPIKKRNIIYSEKDIKNWCDIIEKLGGIKSEPNSSN